MIVKGFGAWCAAGLVAWGAMVGCSSSGSGSTEAIGQSGAAIQGGTTDTSPPHPYAVGVCGGGPGQCQLICSGALIAPNLVLTARHCVDSTPPTVDCTNSKSVFGAQNLPTFYITTNGSLFQNKIGWHKVAKIIRTPGNKLCGNDMALLELADNVPSSEATLVTPVVQYAITEHPRYSTTVTAIGFGVTSATDTNGQSAGTRRIKQNINLQCIPGDKSIDCGNLTGAQMTPEEFLSGDGTCEGDSGSSAYEQKNFNNGVPVSFGVLSRGGQNGTQCLGGIYTRTDSFKSLIVATALQAASDGAYPAPAWTQSVPPPATDAGAPGKDAGGGPAPGQGQLGDACADATDCASGQCQSSDGQSYICTDACDGSAGSCADGYTCSDSGFCFPSAPAADAGPPVSSYTGQSSGCAVADAGADPTKPVPWRSGIAVGLVAAAFAMRRRRGR